MSQIGKAIRLNRVFRSQKRALVVAFDHGFMLGPIPGLEDPARQIRRFALEGINGLLVSLGTLKSCLNEFLVPVAPAILARVDWTNLWYRADAAKTGEFRSPVVASVEDALRNGADAVVTYMFVGSGDASADALEISKNAEVNRECARLGVPHVIESMARGKEVTDPADPKWIRYHTRVASELGADLIKTDYTGNAESMREIIAACPTPILVAGGPRTGSDSQALEMLRGIAQAGAAGVIFGRNVFQADDMPGFLHCAKEILTANEPVSVA